MTPCKWIIVCLPTVILSCWVATSAQTAGGGDKPGSIRSATEAAVNDAAGTLKEAAEAAIPETSTLEKIKLDPAAAFEMLDIIDTYAVERGKYVASIELSNPLKPSFSGKQVSGGGHVLFGLRRPHYRLDETVRVIGSFDLSAIGRVGGFGNSAIVTFRYDFSGDVRRQAFKVSMLIDGISYKIIIPF